MFEANSFAPNNSILVQKGDENSIRSQVDELEWESDDQASFKLDETVGEQIELTDPQSIYLQKFSPKARG